jgi:hypothetical protein
MQILDKIQEVRRAEGHCCQQYMLNSENPQAAKLASEALRRYLKC